MQIRKTKLLGTNKINGHCPANITIQILRDGMVEVDYQNVHVGHKSDIGRLRLTKQERDDLAKKISLKIPMEEILNGVQGSIGNHLQRKDVVSRKDLHNVARDYNLSTTRIADNISVSAFAKENAEIVLLYKQQGVPDSLFPMLTEDDFLLVIMTNAQKEMLLTFGSNYISMDSTHGFK